MAPLALSIIVDAYPGRSGAPARSGSGRPPPGSASAAGPIIGGAADRAVRLVGDLLGQRARRDRDRVVLTLAVRARVAQPGRRAGSTARARRSPRPRCSCLTLRARSGPNEHPWGSARTIGLPRRRRAAARRLPRCASGARAAPMIELALFRSRTFIPARSSTGSLYAGSRPGCSSSHAVPPERARAGRRCETGLSWLALNVPFLVVSPFAGRIVRAASAARPGSSARPRRRRPGHARRRSA